MAGSASQVRSLYTVMGDRRVTETELPWLSGFHGAAPVRVGNAANDQLQLDVFGELADASFLAARAGLSENDLAWSLHRQLVEYLEGEWKKPDSGMWEMRGERRDFVHSKVMAWVAFDRSVKMMESLGLAGPLERWVAARDAVHEEVIRKGYDSARRCFVQYYGSREVDASALLLPQVGFLPVHDPRIAGTVRAVETDLLDGGFVRRYRDTAGLGAFSRGEGCFLPCSFWLADVYQISGRRAEARELFERLVAVSNDVGLLPEEYDPAARRMLGNFPQAFSHVALVNTAYNLSLNMGPARERLEARAPRRRGSEAQLLVTVGVGASGGEVVADRHAHLVGRGGLADRDRGRAGVLVAAAVGERVALPDREEGAASHCDTPGCSQSVPLPVTCATG